MKMSRNNTILLFTSEYPPHIGGVASYYRDLVAAWNTQGESTITVVQATLKPHWIFDGFRLWRAVRTHRPQLVLAGQLLPVGTVTWLLSKILRYEYGVFVHGMDLPYALAKPRKRAIVRRVIGTASTVIAANSYVQTLLVKDNPATAKKITVINPGVTAQVTGNKLQVTKLKEKYHLNGKTVLLQVGRLVKRKGVDMVLAALPRAVEQCDDLVYCVIGNGPQKAKLQVTSKTLQEEGRVLLIDDATNEEVQAWYELCDIFIMPARQIGGDFEGFGIVYLEANAHGKPVIAGDSGGVRDAVIDGVNGLLVNPESVEEITAAMVKLCNDEKLRKKLGEQGRERVKEFSWERQVGKLREVLN
jgi:phosphatidylinositol alpha-1,6-mannosyltransferase